jgi:eukaryotic-like serine/threonine-protein kinase
MADQSRLRRKKIAILGVSGAVVGLVGILMFTGDHERAQPPPAAPAVAFQAERPTVPQPPSTSESTPLVTVSIRATPQSAQIMLDGVPRSNPVEISYPRSAGLHTVRVTADGYAPKTEQISFDSNLMVEMSLERQRAVGAWTPPARAYSPPPARKASVPQQPAVVAAAPAEPPAAPAPPDVSPNGGRPPQRPIDQTNPYGNQ